MLSFKCNKEFLKQAMAQLIKGGSSIPRIATNTCHLWSNSQMNKENHSNAKSAVMQPAQDVARYLKHQVLHFLASSRVQNPLLIGFAQSLDVQSRACHSIYFQSILDSSTVRTILYILCKHQTYIYQVLENIQLSSKIKIKRWRLINIRKISTDTQLQPQVKLSQLHHWSFLGQR